MQGVGKESNQPALHRQPGLWQEMRLAFRQCHLLGLCPGPLTKGGLRAAELHPGAVGLRHPGGRRLASGFVACGECCLCAWVFFETTFLSCIATAMCF